MINVSSNRGAASVLVVFMMLVLVTLGAFAIASANANYRLSKRAERWNAMYYRLDAKGEEYLAEIDAVLAETEVFTKDYILSNKWQNASDDDEIKIHLTDTKALDGDVTDIFSQVFLYETANKLKKKPFANSEINVYNIFTGLELNQVHVKLILFSDDPDYATCGLMVMLEINPPVSVERMSGRLLLNWNNKKRYEVTSWYEFQELVTKGAPMEVWDGFLDIEL